MPSTEAPLLVTLGFDPSTFERLDRLRTHYFPPERNVVPAHLSLFHQLPGDELETIDRTLRGVAGAFPAISLHFAGLRLTGGGILAAVEAPLFMSIRAKLARAFDRWLTPQDRQPFHPHVTIMNKAGRSEAQRAFGELMPSWTRWTGLGDRLILWRYLGGPWDEIESYNLSGGPIANESLPLVEG